MLSNAFKLVRTGSKKVRSGLFAKSAKRNYQTKLLINNQFVPAVSGKTFPTLNPSTEQVITQVAEADKADVDLAVEAANKAFYEGPWSNMGGYERGRLMNKLADLIEKNREELARLEDLVTF
jgi:acyl-CoA reductase-like NAD-dependent aldehyde dehydrogenase